MKSGETVNNYDERSATICDLNLLGSVTWYFVGQMGTQTHTLCLSLGFCNFCLAHANATKITERDLSQNQQ